MVRVICFAVVVLTLAAAVASGCGGDDPAVCTPGQTVSCVCPGSPAPGAQTCLSDGAGFGSCDCGGGSGGNGTGGDDTSSNGGTSSAGASGPGPGPGSGPTSSSGSGIGDCNVGDCVTCQNSDCAKRACTTEWDTCQDNAECAALNDCVVACSSPECFNGCLGDHPDGQADFFAYIGCTVCGDGMDGPCYGDCMGARNCAGM